MKTLILILAIAIASTASAVIPDSLLTVVTNELLMNGYITAVDENKPTHKFVYSHNYITNTADGDTIYKVNGTGVRTVFFIDTLTNSSYQIKMNFKERKALIVDGKKLFVVDDKVLHKQGYKYIKVECE